MADTYFEPDEIEAAHIEYVQSINTAEETVDGSLEVEDEAISAALAGISIKDFGASTPESYPHFRARTRRSARHRRSLDTFDDLAGLSRHIAATREYDAWCAANAEANSQEISAAYSPDEPELVRLLGQENLAPRTGLYPDAEDVVNMAGSQQNHHFPNFESNGGRQAPSPTASPSNGNGVNGSVNTYMAPLPVGHQQDINFLYSQIHQLTSILASNREKVSQITRTAEEVARRANGSLNEREGNKDSDGARIRELELELAKANRTIDIYRHEQGENTTLIAEYENALGTATDQIRNYCCDNNDRYLTQRRHYNDLLQAEKDEHLQSRMERDDWHAKCMKVCEMIRTAYRLRCEEWNGELSVISGLQGEVRILRKCLGMEEEKAEEETGWQYLSQVPSPPPTDEAPVG